LQPRSDINEDLIKAGKKVMFGAHVHGGNSMVAGEGGEKVGSCTEEVFVSGNEKGGRVSKGR